MSSRRAIQSLIDREGQLARVGRDAASKRPARKGRQLSNSYCRYVCGGCTLLAFMATNAVFFYNLAQPNARTSLHPSNGRARVWLPEIQTALRGKKRHYCLKVGDHNQCGDS